MALQFPFPLSALFIGRVRITLVLNKIEAMYNGTWPPKSQLEKLKVHKNVTVGKIYTPIFSF